MDLNNIRIVLVNTSHPGNIGGVARAIKNMGLSRLYLVAPRQYPDEQADWRAASAGDILQNAVVTNTLEEAIGDCQFVVGTSARNRRIPWPLLDPRQCAERMAVASSTEQVAVLFGREDRGLTNEELKVCNLHLNIPTSDAYSSLNLAMAVQIVCYEIRRCLISRLDGGQESQTSPEAPMDHWDQELADQQQMEYFYSHLEKVLIEIDFHDPQNPRQLMTRLRRLFHRIRPDIMELNILRGFLTAVEQTKSQVED